MFWPDCKSVAMLRWIANPTLRLSTSQPTLRRQRCVHQDVAEQRPYRPIKVLNLVLAIGPTI
jgi:hypothetical protein